MIELRAQQITIDAPRKTATPFIAIVVQRLIYDANGDLVQTINREKMINRSLAQLASMAYEYVDPYQPSEGVITGAGLGDALTVAARTCILSEYPEAQLIDGKVILEQ